MGHQWRARLAAGAAGMLAIGSMVSLVAVPSSAGAGARATAPVAAHDTALPQPASDNFWLATPAGALYSFGVPSYGAPGNPLNRPIVGASADR